MKIIQVFFTFLALCVASQSPAGSSDLLSSEEKSKSLSLFAQRLEQAESVKAQGNLQIAAELAQQVSPITIDSSNVILAAPEEEQLKEQSKQQLQHEAGLASHIDGEYYIVKLAYLREGNFPTLYGRLNPKDNKFQNNPDPEYYKQMEKEILTHYLGKDFQKYQPTLVAVAKVVAIHTKIKSAVELQSLLSDGRILRASHIGDYPLNSLIFADDS